MPEEQGALALEVPKAAPTPPPAAPKRFELPAESKPPEAKAPPPPTPAPAQNKEAEAPPAEPEVKPEEKETPEQAAKRQGRRFERRLDKAYRERAEAAARAELLEKELNELKAPKTADDAERPRLEQFDYDPEKYAEAKAKYESAKALKEHEAKQRSEAVKANQAKLISSWEDKAEAASEKYEDFSTVVGELKPTNPLITAIMKADPAVAYHLGKNSKEAERIASLEPIDQIIEIGRLEAKLTAAPEKPKTPSKAPEPIKPLSGTGGTQNDVPSEADDMGSWMKKRNRQIRARS